jgi:hypothetical protein
VLFVIQRAEDEENRGGRGGVWAGGGGVYAGVDERGGGWRGVVRDMPGGGGGLCGGAQARRLGPEARQDRSTCLDYGDQPVCVFFNFEPVCWSCSTK